MRALLSIALLSSVTVLGCADEVSFIPLRLDDGDLAILARVSSGGELLDLSLETKASESRFFEAAPEDTLHVFTLGAEQLLRFDGAPLAGDELAGLRAVHRPSADPLDPCLSCPIPADTSPLLLGPGYSCPLPRFSQHEQRGFGGAEDAADEDEVESLRRSLRLEWPGECPCGRQRLPTRQGPTPSCRPEPEPVLRRWSKLAVTDDGNALALHPSGLLSVTASGAVSWSEFPQPMFIPSVLIPGLPGVASAFALGEFFAERASADLEQRVLALGETGPREIALESPQYRIWRDGLRDAARQAIYLFGGQTGSAEAAVLRCDDRLQGCAPEALGACASSAPALGRDFGAGVLLSNGELLAPRLDGRLQRRAAAETTWRCVEGEAPTPRTSGAATPLNAIQGALVVGDRLFHCGIASSDPEVYLSDHHYVVTARLRPSGSPWHDGPVELYAGRSEHSTCRGLWHDRSDDRVYAFFSNARPFVLTFDANGRYLGEDQAPTFPGISEPIAEVEASGGGRTLLIMTESGALYRSRDGAPPSPIGPAPRPTPAHAVELGERALVLGGGLGARLWSGECGEDALTPAAPLDERLEAVTALPGGEALGVGPNRLVRYSPAHGIIEAWDLSLPRPRAAAHLAGASALILDADGRVYWFSLETGALLPLPQDAAPGRAAETELRFQYLSARDGVGWLSGGAQLARVRLYPGGPKAELWWTELIGEALSEEDTQLGSFGPVTLPCAGQGTLFVRRRRPQLQEPDYFVPRLHMIEPSPEAEGYVTPGLSGLGRPLRASTFSSIPLRMSPSSSPVVVFEDGLMLRPDTEPLVISHPDVTSIVEVGASFVIGTRAGGLEFYRSP